MNLVTLAEHTIDESILPEAPRVLDVGCLGWEFTNEVLRIRPGARITAMDPNPGIIGCCIHAALVGDPARKLAHYRLTATADANSLTDEEGPDTIQVPCLHISDLGGHWDLVKLDCEGSEFGILKYWPGSIADQISVEFHDALWPVVGKEYFSELFRGPLSAYEVLQHEASCKGGPPGHWDTLLRLRKRRA